MENEINNPEEISDIKSSLGAVRPESKTKKIFNYLGMGGLVVSGGLLLILFNILQFIIIAVSGLGMIWWAITLFTKGSIIIGLLVLVIGTPLVIGLMNMMFPFFLFLGLIALAIWGLLHIFGSNVSYWEVGDWVWFSLKVLLVGIMAFVGIVGFIDAIKKNNLSGFFKEYWLGFLFFCFLCWLFFH